MTFYDMNGRAVAYCDDGESIYLFTGEPVAYIFGNLVYTYNGYQLGWFEKGWIRDLQGACVFFTENAIGGMLKPLKKLKPLKYLKRLKPLKGIRRIPRIKPLNRFKWSHLSGENFFFII